jgi:hypothetical protein
MRDDQVLEALKLYVDAMTNAIEVLRQALAKLEKQTQSGLSEVAFDLLKWEASKGSKLGEFECAFKASNMPDKWNHAFNILRANNATIKNHFAPEGFAYRYWLYPEKYQDRIFRKRREPSK